MTLLTAPESTSPTDVRRPPTWSQAIRILLALVVLAAIFPVWGALTSPRAASGRGVPSLPDRFAGFSMLTSSVRDTAAGRAAAIYSYGNGELFDQWQLLAVGADRDSYRRLDGMTRRYELPGGNSPVLLAPDGASVIIAKPAKLLRVDLRTGSKRDYKSDQAGAIRLLAWSPDGSRIAYVGGETGRDEPRYDFSGPVSILDLDTSVSTRLATPDASAAAFSPDSGSIALGISTRALVVDLAGGPSKEISLTSDRQLISNVGWSPDGALLATKLGDPRGDSAMIGFFAVDGRTPPFYLDTEDELLGWAAPDRVVTLTRGDAHIGREIAQVSVRGGARQVISRFSSASDCEFGLQQCHASSVQLATGLLGDMTTRAAGAPDRGPWPDWVRGMTVGVIALVTWLLWLVRRGFQQRSRRRNTRQPGRVGA